MLISPRDRHFKSADRVDPEAELWRAIEIGRRVNLIEAVGVAPTLATIVGADFVRFYATRRETFYEHAEDGVAALIVGVVGWDDDRLFPIGPPPPDVMRDSYLYDLAAIELEGERVGTRLGIAATLGEYAIEAARDHGSLYDPARLRLLTPLQWVREPDGAAAILDWSRAPYILQDCPGITFPSLDLAERVEAAFARPIPCPRLTVEVVS